MFHNLVCHVPISLGYCNLNIVQLEMINILVAIKLFGNHWEKQGVKIYCDNIAEVKYSLYMVCLQCHWLIKKCTILSRFFKINCPLCITKCNIISIDDLCAIW